MRQIKFRGKDKETGKWVYGYYVFCRGHHYILEQYNKNGYDERYIELWTEIIPETVGQWTGLRDKNRVEIYEEDILSPNIRQVLWRSNAKMGTVFNCAGWYTRCYKPGPEPECLGDFTFGITQADASEIIGNAYDNPEILTN